MRVAAAGARTSKGLAAGAALLVALVVAVVGMFVLADAFAEDDRVPEVARNGQVSEEDYAAVELGMGKEEVQRLLRPAAPVDTNVLSEFDLRQPETPASTCVYYESDGGVADDLYRFCFDAGDALVDKTTILPPENGVTGAQ